VLSNCNHQPEIEMTEYNKRYGVAIKGHKVQVCYNLTPPPPKDHYEFSAARCKKAIESLSKMVYDKDYTNIPDKDAVLLGVILDDLCLDIEALYRRAKSFDDLYDSVASLPVWESNNGEFVPADEVQGLVDDWAHDPVAELNL